MAKPDDAAEAKPAASSGPGDVFADTSWTAVMIALGSDSPSATAALEQLCQKYWHPIYCYVRRRGYGPHDAEDLTQGFFFEVVHNKRMRAANRTKGKFRAYLLTAVNGFLANHWHFTHAAKRGGGRPIISLDATSAEQRYILEPALDESPDKHFERRWAFTVLEQVHTRLLEEHQANGRADFYRQVQGLLLEGAERKSYTPVAQQLGLSENALTVAVHRLRQRFRLRLREEIARTVGCPEEVEDEMRHLYTVLASP